MAHIPAERCLAIIELLANGAREMPLGEVAERLSLPKSGAHRLLTTLVEQGWTEQNASTGFYRLSPPVSPQRFVKGRAPGTYVRFTGRFVNLWGVTDVAAFGDTVVALSPEGDDPLKRVTWLTVEDEDALRMTKTTGYGAPGETLRYVRNGGGARGEDGHGRREHLSGGGLPRAAVRRVDHAPLSSRCRSDGDDDHSTTNNATLMASLYKPFSSCTNR